MQNCQMKIKRSGLGSFLGNDHISVPVRSLSNRSTVSAGIYYKYFNMNDVGYAIFKSCLFMTRCMSIASYYGL